MVLGGFRLFLVNDHTLMIFGNARLMHVNDIVFLADLTVGLPTSCLPPPCVLYLCLGQLYSSSPNCTSPIIRSTPFSLNDNLFNLSFCAIQWPWTADARSSGCLGLPDMHPRLIIHGFENIDNRSE